MTETLKTLSAGLLTLSVIGGVGALLTMSLATPPPMSLDSTQPMSLVGTRPTPAVQVASIQQTAIETVVVYGTKPANYASLVAHRKEKGNYASLVADRKDRGAVGTYYAAMWHKGLGTIALEEK